MYKVDLDEELLRVTLEEEKEKSERQARRRKPSNFSSRERVREHDDTSLDNH